MCKTPLCEIEKKKHKKRSHKILCATAQTTVLNKSGSTPIGDSHENLF